MNEVFVTAAMSCLGLIVIALGYVYISKRWYNGTLELPTPTAIEKSPEKRMEYNLNALKSLSQGDFMKFRQMYKDAYNWAFETFGTNTYGEHVFRSDDENAYKGAYWMYDFVAKVMRRPGTYYPKTIPRLEYSMQYLGSCFQNKNTPDNVWIFAVQFIKLIDGIKARVPEEDIAIYNSLGINYKKLLTREDRHVYTPFNVKDEWLEYKSSSKEVKIEAEESVAINHKEALKWGGIFQEPTSAVIDRIDNRLELTRKELDQLHEYL